MKPKKILPSEIEKESFRIIKDELREMGKEILPELEPTVLRVIHTTADFEYADTLLFSEDVIKRAKDAIRRGAHIVTDTNMALAGISKKTLAKYGGEVHCFMADEEVAKEAGQRRVTRAYVSMEKASGIKAPLIFAIGNAPTALIKLRELMDEGKLQPELIIAVPVGFVNVVEAKELILESSCPYIVNAGRKGGSGVAAAICNSLLYNMEDEPEDKKLRFGYTTGSCAAAASKAALKMLLSGETVNNVSIMTPKGIIYNADIIDISNNIDEKSVSCAVVKDGGDDPDITSGSRIYAEVSLIDGHGIIITGGEGVGRVTKPGLDQPIGEAAINSVPRRMISEQLQEVLDDYGMQDRGVKVTISVPGGEELAQRTFNPKLGIVGGISILGTTGIVEPMSDEAILETIKTEIRVHKAEGKEKLIVAPGNYGLTFLGREYGINEEDAVLCSNFVYDTIRYAAEQGFEKILFAGHIGKLVKIAGGIKNTHSKYGDHRMEILTELSEGFLNDDEFEKVKNQLSECVMTDEAVRILSKAGIGEAVFNLMAQRIKENIEDWADNKINATVVVFSNDYSVLTSTYSRKEYKI